MKKNLLVLVVVFSAMLAGQGQDADTLIYDEGDFTAFQSFFPERVFAVKMSPSGPCEVLVMQFYVQKDGGAEGAFVPALYNWEDTQPATNAVYEDLSVIVPTEWKDVNVDGTIKFDGDFAVGFKPLDQASYLAYDEDLDNGRSWILDITDMVWSEESSRGFLIRAIVQYTATGIVEELQGVVNLYPNPVTDVLNIESDMQVQSLTIFNVAGQVVREELVNMENTRIDLSDLQKGVYLVKMEGNNDKIIKKIVVK